MRVLNGLPLAMDALRGLLPSRNLSILPRESVPLRGADRPCP